MGEVKLTIDIILGLMLGEMIIRFRVADTLLKRFMPFLERHNIPKITGLALGASLGSSRTGAAIISSALTNHELTEHEAVWSVLMLPFPAYLRRWPSTMIMSVSLAGLSGGIFALSLLLRSAARFFLAYSFLKNAHQAAARTLPIKISSDAGSLAPIVPPNACGKQRKAASHILMTLPTAWICFAVTYSLVPFLKGYFRAKFTGSLLPLCGWGVAAASLGHISSALALAGGGLASGELRESEAVFALILGSGLGTATRLLRQNAGYYFGLFSPKTAQKLLFLNFITIMPIIMMNLLFSGLALLF